MQIVVRQGPVPFWVPTEQVNRVADAQLSDDPLHHLADRTAARISTALTRKQSIGKVVPLRRGEGS